MCTRLDEGDDEESVLMLVDFQTSCNTAQHLGFVAFATIMVVLWPIGLPSFCFYILFRNRSELQKEGSAIREELSPLVRSIQWVFILV